MVAKFTPEELAELARFDAEIEDCFQLTLEEWKQAEELDDFSEIQLAEPDKLRKREKDKRFYEANKSEILERLRRYYRSHREHLLLYGKVYRKTFPTEIAEYKRAYRESNRERISA